MATVTIGKTYFETLLRRADYHTSGPDIIPGLPHTSVTISTTEYEYLVRSAREYNLLREALLRGGLTHDALQTLVSPQMEDSHVHSAPSCANEANGYAGTFTQSNPVQDVSIRDQYRDDHEHITGNVREGNRLGLQGNDTQPHTRASSFGQAGSSLGTNEKLDDPDASSPHRVPTHGKRTILITNLSDRTTHKDLVEVIRGGRLAEIYLRNDRCATVSFVEGAAEFLAHTKKNDIYLNQKRLEFRWHDRQFQVPPHVSDKIAKGATRNLVVRGAAAKQIAPDQIREHLDHIHNLVVIDVNMRNGDAYISTNSIHNGLFARTCMMSRTAYKGLRIDWYPDECAAPLPKVIRRVQSSPSQPSMKSKPFSNPYGVLDDCPVNSDADSEDESYLSNGVRLNWADPAVV
ncbi:uncharacterized protein EI97DRAFT_242673 [Westerdykella ornata]|uniref:RRM domain-containing protein n=1 Tax=Westerdykella ornata TaxID=318751 RepID=A0A6A6J5R9_WESOR|nr:uncharacterized protein EI97DRAFT_242673 [Westerdykella ornata]KAF2271785.1 hypothetical protein EI97DRAFT_242673 [Westerdykella ornata]